MSIRRASLAAWLLLCHGTAHADDRSIVVDNDTDGVTATGSWGRATAATDHYGTLSEYARSSRVGANQMRFTPDLPATGMWQVEAWNSCFTPRGDNVPHTIRHADGIKTVLVDQDSRTGICAAWVVLGEFLFRAGTSGSVTISDTGVEARYVGADAIRFTRLPSRAAADIRE